MGGNLTNYSSNVEWLIPYDDTQAERKGRQEVFAVLIVLLGLSLLLGIAGVIIEYSRLGNVKLSHEETNFSGIDIPTLQ